VEKVLGSIPSFSSLLTFGCVVLLLLVGGLIGQWCAFLCAERMTLERGCISKADLILNLLTLGLKAIETTLRTPMSAVCWECKFVDDNLVEPE
jgi:hypothetical protein